MRSSQLNLAQYDTDKIANRYFERYDPIFEPLIEKEIVLLELGVDKGGSLLLWRDYFPQGKIVGIDINLSKGFHPIERIHVYEGSQADPQFLSQVANETAPDGFDIIIDDASHIGELTKIAFWHLFDNHLKSGGLYVIEDWGTGYYNKFPDGKKYLVKRNINRQKFQRLIDKIIKQAENTLMNRTLLKRGLMKFLRTIRIMSLKRKYKSHNYGLVGFVKELIDEMGMDIITSQQGNPSISAKRRFASMEIYPGQIFIIKKK
jgi:hypothetical protein